MILTLIKQKHNILFINIFIRTTRVLDVSVKLFNYFSFIHRKTNGNFGMKKSIQFCFRIDRITNQPDYFIHFSINMFM